MRVTDVAALKKLGVSPRAVSLLVAETFNEMIFTHGYVHCDPHAANMLVRKVVSGGFGEGRKCGRPCGVVRCGCRSGPLKHGAWHATATATAEAVDLGQTLCCPP